jgi:ribA/ribD-fused uncharacterized protein
VVEPISSFSGEYRWLSNFSPSLVIYDGVVYPTVEHAYQAAKVHPSQREPFKYGTPGQAKRLGRQYVLRADWEQVKVYIMRELIEKKFIAHTPMAARLLATGDAELVEGNTWGDMFWGVCSGVGKNYLGKLLMERRTALRYIP